MPHFQHRLIGILSQSSGTRYNIIYGFLYNRWAAYMGPKFIPKTGWRVSVISDWTTLESYINANYSTPTELMTQHIKSRRMQNSPLGGEWNTTVNPYWDYNATHYGLDTVNLNFQGTGSRAADGSFGNIRNRSYIWIPLGTTMRAVILINTNNSLNIQTSVGFLAFGMTVYLVRAATTAEQLLADGTYVADYVGNTNILYKAVKVGTQIWTEPMIETHFNDGTEIPEVTASADWAALDAAQAYGRCSYNNNQSLAYL